MRSITHGLMARFAGETELADAIRSLFQKGYHCLEASTPHESEPVLDALRLDRSRIPLIAFVAAVIAGTGAWGLLWWTRNIGMALDVGARPNVSSWADLPIIFESSVLGASVVSFIVVIVRMGLPRLRHPWFEVPRFESASPAWWLAVDATDVSSESELRRTLTELGAISVDVLRDPDSGQSDPNDNTEERAS